MARLTPCSLERGPGARAGARQRASGPPASAVPSNGTACAPSPLDGELDGGAERAAGTTVTLPVRGIASDGGVSAAVIRAT